MLTFVGLGLGGEGISLRGLRAAQQAEVVFAEFYTSLLPGLDLGQLERSIGRAVKAVNRRVVEEDPAEILEAARVKDVVFLVPGDPMVATTHVDLRLRAAKAGIATRVIPAASIASAAAGLVGLQSYRFGPSATVPFLDNRSIRPYEVLAENLSRGLHTMLFLDLREGKRAMTANEAIEIMFDLEEELRKGVFTPARLSAVVARAGSDDCLVKANRADRLSSEDFGPPPHLLIVPGRLHFLEAEALQVFAGAPEGVVQWHMRQL